MASGDAATLSALPPGLGWVAAALPLPADFSHAADLIDRCAFLAGDGGFLFGADE